MGKSRLHNTKNPLYSHSIFPTMNQYKWKQKHARHNKSLDY